MANVSSTQKAVGNRGTLPTLFPDPKRMQRPPVNGADVGVVGQLWVDIPNQDVYCCVSTTTWADIGATSGSFVNVVASGYIEAAGNIYTTGGDIIADTGDIEATAGNIFTTGGNISAIAGSVSAGTTLSAIGNISTSMGNISANTGNITATLGDIVATAGHIVATNGNVTASAGTITGDILATANATDGLNITSNIIEAVGSSTDINIEIAPKGTGVIALGALLEFGLAGGIRILTGSGAPAATAPQGSLYLRTDGSGVNDRAYINTDGAATWTAIVTVA